MRNIHFGHLILFTMLCIVAYAGIVFESLPLVVGSIGLIVILYINPQESEERD